MDPFFLYMGPTGCVVRMWGVGFLMQGHSWVQSWVFAVIFVGVFMCGEFGGVKGVGKLTSTGRSYLSVRGGVGSDVSPRPGCALRVRGGSRAVGLAMGDKLRGPCLCGSGTCGQGSATAVRISALRFSELVLRKRGVEFRRLAYGSRRLSFRILRHGLSRGVRVRDFDGCALGALGLCSGSGNCGGTTKLLTSGGRFPKVSVMGFNRGVDVVRGESAFRGVSMLRRCSGSMGIFESCCRCRMVRKVREGGIRGVPRTTFERTVTGTLVRET